MRAVPTNESHFADEKEQKHMKNEDAAAFESACLAPLKAQITGEIESMGDFSVLERMARHGTESLVSRANFRARAPVRQAFMPARCTGSGSIIS